VRRARRLAPGLPPGAGRHRGPVPQRRGGGTGYSSLYTGRTSCTPHLCTHLVPRARSSWCLAHRAANPSAITPELLPHAPCGEPERADGPRKGPGSLQDGLLVPRGQITRATGIRPSGGGSVARVAVAHNGYYDSNQDASFLVIEGWSRMRIRGRGTTAQSRDRRDHPREPRARSGGTGIPVGRSFSPAPRVTIVAPVRARLGAGFVEVRSAAAGRFHVVKHDRAARAAARPSGTGSSRRRNALPSR
jgi:hypothetical protein